MFYSIPPESMHLKWSYEIVKYKTLLEQGHFLFFLLCSENALIKTHAILSYLPDLRSSFFTTISTLLAPILRQHISKAKENPVSLLISNKTCNTILMPEDLSHPIVFIPVAFK